MIHNEENNRTAKPFDNPKDSYGINLLTALTERRHVGYEWFKFDAEVLKHVLDDSTSTYLYFCTLFVEFELVNGMAEVLKLEGKAHCIMEDKRIC